MQSLGRYDGALGMFVATQPAEPDARHLEFQRWLADEGLHALDTGAWPLRWNRDANLWEWQEVSGDDD